MIDIDPLFYFCLVLRSGQGGCSLTQTAFRIPSYLRSEVAIASLRGKLISDDAAQDYGTVPTVKANKTFLVNVRYSNYIKARMTLASPCSAPVVKRPQIVWGPHCMQTIIEPRKKHLEFVRLL